MYPAHNRAGRGNLQLRNSVLHLPPNFGGVAMSGVTLRHVLPGHQSDKIEIKV